MLTNPAWLGKISVVYSDVLYGYLYNWYAVDPSRDSSITSSSDWVVPSDSQWDTLINYLTSNGFETNAGAALSGRDELWVDGSLDSNEDFNALGFEAVPGGRRRYDSEFEYIEQTGYWWTSTDSNSIAYYRKIEFYDTNVSRDYDLKKFGNSVKLVKPTTTLTNGQQGTYTGNDGKVYRTVCIGTQEWLVGNLAETLYRDSSYITTIEDDTEWRNDTEGAKCPYGNNYDNVPDVKKELSIYSYWKLDSDLNDSHINSIDGTASGTIGYDSSGKIGSCLSLTGLGAVLLPTGTIKDNFPFTFTCWFKTTVGGGIIGYNNSQYPSTPSNRVPMLYVDTNNKLRAGLWEVSLSYVVSTDSVTDGVWHFAALVASDTKMELYLDSVSQGSNFGNYQHLDMEYNQIGATYGKWWANHPSEWSRFNGCIDEAAIFKYELEQDEIDYIFNDGNGRIYENI